LISRKKLVVILALLAGLLVAGLLGVFGYFQYREYRLRKTLSISEAAYARGDWDLARRGFGLYLRRKPDSVGILLKYADSSCNIAVSRPHRLRDAIMSYNQITRILPNDTEAMQRLVKFCLKIRAWRELEYYSERFMGRFPDDAWLAYCHAVALDELNRTQEAIEEFKTLAEEGTEYADVYFRLAECLRQLGFNEQAEELLDKAVNDAEGNPQILAQRALYRVENNLLAEASADIEQARGGETVLDKVDITVLFAAARLAEKKKEWEHAVELGQAALAKDAASAKIRFLLIRVFEQQGKYDDAIRLIEEMGRFQRLDDTRFLVLYNELLAQTNQLEQAQEVLDEYSIAFPDQVMVTEYMRARLLLAEGDFSGAAAKFNTVVQNVPDFRQAHYYLAVSLLQSRQRQHARNALVIMLHSFPDDAFARALFEREFSKPKADTRFFAKARNLLVQEDAEPRELAAAAEQLFLQNRQLNDDSQIDTVRALLETAIKRDPQYERSYVVLADFYLRAGMPAQAETVLAKAEEHIDELKDGPILRAWIAIAAKEEPAAFDEFRKELAKEGFLVSDVRRWANSFAARGNIDSGLSVFQMAEEAMPPGEAEKLHMDGVNLCMRFGDLDRALSLLASREAGASASENASEIVSVKEQLILLLLQSDKPNHIAEAKKLVGPLSAARPDEDRFQLLQARVFINQDPPDFDGAWAILEQMHEARPSDAGILSHMADLAIKQENIVAAIDYARRAAAADPQNAGLHIKLAEIQLLDKRAAEAQATLEHSLTLTPDSPRAFELLVNAYLLTGRTEHAEGALARLEQLLEGGEKQWKLSFLRGRVQAARGQNMRATEAMFRDRYVRNPDDAVTLRELALLVALQGRDDEAEQLLLGFAENHPDQADAWVMLGQYHLSKGDNAAAQGKASSAFTRALIIHPNYAPALRGLIGLSQRANNMVQMLVLCDRYLALYPVSPDILYKKALLLAEYKKDLPAALETIEQALALEQRREYVYMRGRLYLAQARFEDALKDFQEAGRSRDINSPSLDMSLAEACIGLKDIPMAKRYYEAATRKLKNGMLVNEEQLKRIGQMIDEQDGNVS